MKLSLVSLIIMVAFAGSGCPDDRKAAIEAVGGAPKAQVDEAHKRLDKAEELLQRNAAAAAANE